MLSYLTTSGRTAKPGRKQGRMGHGSWYGCVLVSNVRLKNSPMRMSSLSVLLFIQQVMLG